MCVLGGFLTKIACCDWLRDAWIISTTLNRQYSYLSCCHCWLLSLFSSICQFVAFCLIPDAVLLASILCCY